MYYPEIRKMVFDVDKIAKNTGFSKSDVLKVKKYLFLDESYYDESLGKWVRFPSDGAIAQSWQRMKDQKPKPHDITLLKHELEEMKIKEDNPGISHTKAHELAQKKYNYQKEADEYYGSLRKLSEK